MKDKSGSTKDKKMQSIRSCNFGYINRTLVASKSISLRAQSSCQDTCWTLYMTIIHPVRKISSLTPYRNQQNCYYMYRFRRTSFFFPICTEKLKPNFFFLSHTRIFFRNISVRTSPKQDKAHEVKFYNWIL